MSDVVELSNSERTGTRFRFKNMFDLHARFRSVEKMSSEKKTERENYVKAYNKWPYKKKDGSIDTNFGVFRQKIDNAIAEFKDLVVNRNRWANITPIFCDTPEQKEDYRQKISEAWHELFVSTWENRSGNTKKDVFDMIMFGKGIEIWDSMSSVYPESIPMENCYPESKASLDSSEWGLFFYTKNYTVNEIMLEIEDDDIAKRKGWDRDTVLDFIRKHKLFQNAGPNSQILEDFRTGNLQVDLLELEIRFVFAFVKENKKTVEGNREGYITHYVMPYDEWVTEEGSDKKESRYFKFFPAFAECMGEVVRVRCYSHSRSYWETTSYAEEIIVTCMTVDKTTNRILRNATRRSSVFLESENVDSQEKLSNLSLDKEFTVLDPGVKLTQTSVGSDARELMEITRQISFENERNGGSHLATGAQNVKGRAITAEEARQNSSRESASASSDLDSFADQDSGFLKTLFCKTIKAELTESECDKKIKKLREIFKKKMNEFGIKPEFYDPENVIVESNMAIGAGSPASKSSFFRELFNFISFRPSTIGEERLKRDAIAAVASEEKATYYMGPSMEAPGNESQHAGNENAIMENPDVNPLNAQVLGDDNHEVHIKIHMTDMNENLKVAQQRLKLIPQTPQILIPTLLDKIHGKLAGAENKAAHITAHIQMLSKDESKKGFIAQVERDLKQTQQVIAIVKSQFDQASQNLIKNQQQDFQLTEKERHLKAMNAETERSLAAINNIELGKAVEKAQLSHDIGKMKAQQQAEQSDQSHSQQMDQKRQEAALSLASQTIEQEKKINDAQTSQGEVPQQSGS